MFIATANALDTIHPALLDRIEVIDISGYSVDEKVQIAKRYIVPKQIADNGINQNIIGFSDETLKNVV
jgi:ATP-dependent Lon protease